MTALENHIGKRVAVELLDGHRFTAVLKNVRRGEVVLESKTGWRSYHPIEEIRKWRPINRSR